MKELPKEYIPSCMKEVESQKVPLMFAIGRDNGNGGMGMTDGPVPTLKEMLEIPGRDNNFCIVRFNIDGTDEIIYRWVEDKWVLNKIMKER